MQRVLDGKSFTQKLGIPRDFDAVTDRCQFPRALTEPFRGSHRYRGLAEDDRGLGEQRRQSLDHGIHVDHVSGELTLLLRRPDPEEEHVRKFCGFLVRRRELQSPSIDVSS